MTSKQRCRICLDDSPYKNVFSSKVKYGGTVVTCRDIMINLFSLTVTRGDGLPSCVCKKCFLKLSSAYKLKMLAEKSYLTLLDYILKADCEKEAKFEENRHVECLDEKVKLEHCSEDGNDDDVEPHLSADEFADEKMNFANIKTEIEFGTEDLDNVPLIQFANSVRDFRKRRKRLKSGEEKGHNRSRARKKRDLKDGICELCGKEVKQLKHHMKTHDLNREQYPCKLCSKTFLTLSARGTHMKVAHLSAPYFCEICKKSYKWKDNHIREVHSGLPTPHECNICDQKFTVLSRLKLHMATHTKERPFLCQICGKAFKTKQLCNEHRGRVHDNEKKFECQYCSKRVYSKSELKDHIKVHTKEKSFKCDECGKLFARMHELKNHTLLHSGIKNEKCQFCDKLFYNKGALSTHMITHTKEKKHECKYCGIKFGRTDHRNKHERTVHENANQTKERCGSSMKRENEDALGLAHDRNLI